MTASIPSGERCGSRQGGMDLRPAVRFPTSHQTITTDEPVDRARRLVELALRDATITRTLARGLDLAVVLTINDHEAEAPHVA